MHPIRRPVQMFSNSNKIHIVNKGIGTYYRTESILGQLREKFWNVKRKVVSQLQLLPWTTKIILSLTIDFHPDLVTDLWFYIQRKWYLFYTRKKFSCTANTCKFKKMPKTQQRKLWPSTIRNSVAMLYQISQLGYVLTVNPWKYCCEGSPQSYLLLDSITILVILLFVTVHMVS